MALDKRQFSGANISEMRPMGQRRMRRPQHRFYLRSRPWQIQPFLIAPVLPGETMRTLLLQARTVTDPINSKLIGWWNEYYIFYCKMSDLPGSTTWQSMLVDPSTDVSGQHAAALVEHYHRADTVDWVAECLQSVVEHYFRDEGEAWDTYKIGNLPVASISLENALDSVINDAAYAAVGDIDVDIDADATVTASEVERALMMWQHLKANNLTDMTYEDYLATYGVSIPAAEIHKPELVRYVRDWTYPTNAVEPTDGSVASACVWSTAERADKDRFFREPGFLFGVSVCRPKVYLAEQLSHVVDILDNAYRWLPAALTNDAAVAWAQFNGTTTNSPNPADGPLQGVADDYWLDTRDLFLYGDQFLNFDPSAETDINRVDLPTSALQKRYPVVADANNLMVAGASGMIRQDGVVSLHIASRQADQSPRIGVSG